MNLEALFAGRTCETCGHTATSRVVDMAETEPIVVKGEAYRSIRPDGEHFYCKEHARPSLRKEFFNSQQEEADWLIANVYGGQIPNDLLQPEIN